MAASVMTSIPTPATVHKHLSTSSASVSRKLAHLAHLFSQPNSEDECSEDEADDMTVGVRSSPTASSPRFGRVTAKKRRSSGAFKGAGHHFVALDLAGEAIGQSPVFPSKRSISFTSSNHARLALERRARRPSDVSLSASSWTSTSSQSHNLIRKKIVNIRHWDGTVPHLDLFRPPAYKSVPPRAQAKEEDSFVASLGMMPISVSQRPHTDSVDIERPRTPLRKLSDRLARNEATVKHSASFSDLRSLGGVQSKRSKRTVKWSSPNGDFYAYVVPKPKLLGRFSWESEDIDVESLRRYMERGPEPVPRVTRESRNESSIDRRKRNRKESSTRDGIRPSVLLKSRPVGAPPVTSRPLHPRLRELEGEAGCFPSRGRTLFSPCSSLPRIRVRLGSAPPPSTREMGVQTDPIQARRRSSSMGTLTRSTVGPHRSDSTVRQRSYLPERPSRPLQGGSRDVSVSPPRSVHVENSSMYVPAKGLTAPAVRERMSIISHPYSAQAQAHSNCNGAGGVKLQTPTLGRVANPFDELAVPSDGEGEDRSRYSGRSAHLNLDEPNDFRDLFFYPPANRTAAATDPASSSETEPQTSITSPPTTASRSQTPAGKAIDVDTEDEEEVTAVFQRPTGALFHQGTFTTAKEFESSSDSEDDAVSSLTHVRAWLRSEEAAGRIRREPIPSYIDFDRSPQRSAEQTSSFLDTSHSPHRRRTSANLLATDVPAVVRGPLPPLPASASDTRQSYISLGASLSSGTSITNTMAERASFGDHSNASVISGLDRFPVPPELTCPEIGTPSPLLAPPPSERRSSGRSSSRRRPSATATTGTANSEGDYSFFDFDSPERSAHRQEWTNLPSKVYSLASSATPHTSSSRSSPHPFSRSLEDVGLHHRTSSDPPDSNREASRQVPWAKELSETRPKRHSAHVVSSH